MVLLIKLNANLPELPKIQIDWKSKKFLNFWFINWPPSALFTVSHILYTKQWNKTLLLDPKVLNCDSSVKCTLIHRPFVQSLCILNHQNLPQSGFLNRAFLTIILLYRQASQSLLSVDLAHLFTTLVLLCCYLEPSVIQAGACDEIVLFSFWSFGLVLSHSLISPKNIIYCSSFSVLKKKHDFKSIFQKGPDFN